MSQEDVTCKIEEIENRTEKAILVKLCDVDVALWLPLSQIELTDDEIVLPYWLAEEEGLLEDDKDVL